MGNSKFKTIRTSSKNLELLVFMHLFLLLKYHVIRPWLHLPVPTMATTGKYSSQLDIFHDSTPGMIK